MSVGVVQASQAHHGFEFRNHTTYTSQNRPRFRGDWNRLSDGSHTSCPGGVIALVSRSSEGWTISVPRKDEHSEIVSGERSEE